MYTRNAMLDPFMASLWFTLPGSVRRCDHVRRSKYWEDEEEAGGGGGEPIPIVTKYPYSSVPVTTPRLRKQDCTLLLSAS